MAKSYTADWSDEKLNSLNREHNEALEALNEPEYGPHSAMYYVLVESLGDINRELERRFLKFKLGA